MLPTVAYTPIMMIETPTMEDTMTYTHNNRWTLTTDHAASSYGIPVLLIEGVAYGPADRVPGLPNADIFGGTTAASLVAGLSDNAPNNAKILADKYLRSWPTGPQLCGVRIITA